ncbi:hypothetical protein FQN54_003150 [Arachnomyces sp. PD_36]|nr:hypothetical protein FQN54_003150 [Arachnomyces sp. PD_36]
MARSRGALPDAGVLPPENLWTGLIFDQSPMRDSESKKVMFESLVNQTKDDIRKDRNTRAFGNGPGLQIMDEFRKMQADIQSLNGRVDSLESVSKAHLSIRLHVLQGLDDWDSSEKKISNRRSIRNEKAHGGDILADCFVLKGLREEKNFLFEQCSKKFLTMYDVKYENIHEAIPKAPQAVLKLYDFRAHVRLLLRWRYADTSERKNIRKNIEENCGQALKGWEEWVADSCRGPGPNLKKESEEVEKLYVEF